MEEIRLGRFRIDKSNSSNCMSTEVKGGKESLGKMREKNWKVFFNCLDSKDDDGEV